MNWLKLGRIYNPEKTRRHSKLKTHVSNPTVIKLKKNIVRVFYSGRDKHNRSSVGAFDFDLYDLKVVNDYYEPVLGLPDTLKSKLLIPFRENIISSLLEDYRDSIQSFDFDFNTSLDSFNTKENKKWQRLRDGVV